MVQVVDGDDRDSVEKTGQNWTLPDIGVMQIIYGGDDEEDRLMTELRTGTLRGLFTCQSYWPGLNAWPEKNSRGMLKQTASHVQPVPKTVVPLL